MTSAPPAWLRTIVTEAVGGPITDCRQPADGANAETYILDVADRSEPVVYKGAGASIWTGEVIEPLVTAYVGRRTDVPVPTVLAHGDGGPHRRWAIYGYCQGKAMRTATGTQRRRLVEEAGRLLGRLHSQLPRDRLGRLGRRGDRLVVTADGGILDTPLGRQVRPARDRQPVVHHGDYHPGNILVSDGRITGVLDWGNAYVTDAAYAAAVGELRVVDLLPAGDRQVLRRAFRAGYREHGTLTAGYKRRAAGYKLLWLLQSARNLTEVATTRRGRRQLGRQLRNWLGRRTRSLFTVGGL